MSKKKPDNCALADQLKSLRDKLAADQAAQAEAQKRARARADEEKARARTEAEDKLSDDERFQRALGGMGQRDVIRKFDAPPPSRGAPAAPAPKPASDEDLFLRALNAAPPPKPKG